jgi:hypothetical protein
VVWSVRSRVILVFSLDDAHTHREWFTSVVEAKRLHKTLKTDVMASDGGSAVASGLRAMAGEKYWSYDCRLNGE